jgi:hypothetical protein
LKEKTRVFQDGKTISKTGDDGDNDGEDDDFKVSA